MSAAPNRLIPADLVTTRWRAPRSRRSVTPRARCSGTGVRGQVGLVDRASRFVAGTRGGAIYFSLATGRRFLREGHRGRSIGMFTEDMRRVVEAELGFIATVCPDGTPNLSPKGTTAVWDDDHLVFADLRSPGTVENLRSNASIEINVVDQLIRKGYRFKGTGAVYTEGDVFERGVQFYEARGTIKARERIRGI